MCAQMLMHAIAHRGCTDAIRESALKADSGRKDPVPHQALKPVPVLHLAFQLDTLPTKLSAPRDHCRANVNDLFATGVCSSTPNLPLNPF